MKKFISFICLAILLASCNIKIDSTEKPRDVDPTAVGFNVYVNRGVQTKAGWAGTLVTDSLELSKVGFGVFSYYGNGALYNETMMPDFMYNQQVLCKKYTGTSGTQKIWEYTPIKYWPPLMPK